MTNFHIFKISYIGATNNKGSRIKIHSERFKKSRIISYNYQFNNTLDGALDYLTKKGFEIVGQAEGKDCYYVISNTFSQEF